MGAGNMSDKPSFYQRCQDLLHSNYNADLKDFDIFNEKQLLTQWPKTHYSPAEIVDHYAHKYGLKALWDK